MNAITYKEIFPLIMQNKVWLGNGFNAGNAYFRPASANVSGYASGVYDEKTGLVKFRNCCWFTNLDHGRRHQPLQLMSMADNLKFSKHKEVKEQGYQRYDNYDAIEIPFTDAIPCDYDGVMGVPITFLAKYCPEQFEIVNGMNRYMILGEEELNEKIRVAHSHLCNIEGKASYFRILIRKRAEK